MELTILVVDDDADVREALVWMLEDDGHVVLEAADGGTALEILAADPSVDLVVSDVNMPAMDGVELARRIALGYPCLPVLLISGRPQRAMPRPFLSKPFRWDVLSRTIAMLAAPT